MNAPIRAYQARRPTLLLLRERTQEADRSPGGDTPHPDAATDWAKVHEQLVRLGRDRGEHERNLCEWLLAAERLGVHTCAGHASLREYAERVVGLSPRQTEERLRVGRALRALPKLDAALAQGELPWSAVRELTRVATSETEAEWLAWAKGRRTHQIEKDVSMRRPGDRPRTRPDRSLAKHRLRFDVRAETFALYRDLRAKVRADLGGEADEDAVLFEIVRRALGGPGDDARASYQVAVTRCQDCGRADIDAAGESHEVEPAVAEMAACDAQEVGRVDGPHAGAKRASQTIPPAIRRQVLRRDRGRCVVPGCSNHVFLDVHHLDERAEGGGHDPERLAALCGAHHRAVHAGRLSIDGKASEGFVVRHVDGTEYGAPLRPQAVDVARQALGALQHSGFKPSEARARVDAVVRAGAPADLEGFLRAALAGAS